MITGEYDKLVEIAKFNVCSVHKTPLEVAWDKKQWGLRCGGNGGHFPDAVTHNPSLTQLYKEGVALPSPIEDNIKRSQRRKSKVENRGDKITKFALVPQTDLGTGQLLLPEVIRGLVAYADKYHLNPELGHVVLMYGKPYITIDGYLYHARQSGAAYSLESRPISGDEHDAYMLGSTDHGWLATVTILNTREEYTGLGIVTLREINEPSKHDPNIPAHPVVANNPQLLCQKRAEWQALRRAFPIGGEQ